MALRSRQSLSDPNFSVIKVKLSDSELKELIVDYPNCPVESLFSKLNEFDGSNEGLEDLYVVLKWIENHEGELAKLRRLVESKIIDHRFKDVKV